MKLLRRALLVAALLSPAVLRAQKDNATSANGAVRFAVKTFAGDTVRIGVGAPTTLVAVFATWCQPCRGEVPAINMLQHDFGSRVRVVAVTVDEGSDAHIQGWLKQYGAQYPVGRSSARNAAKAFGTHGVPAVFLVQSDGTIAWENDGALLSVLPELRARLKALPAHH